MSSTESGVADEDLISRFNEFRDRKVNVCLLESDRSVRAASKELRRIEPSLVGLDFETAFKTRPSFNALAGSLRLIQIGLDEPERGIEPLQIIVDCHRADPRPLVRILRDRQIEKQIHNQRFEQEWALVHFGHSIESSYDTKLAMEVIQRRLKRDGGHEPHNNKLGTLVRRYLGLELPKEHGGSDWGRAQLSSGQLVYAALDVAVMPALSAEIKSIADRIGVGADVDQAIIQDRARINELISRRCEKSGDDLRRLRRAIKRCRDKTELARVYGASRQMTLLASSRRELDADYRARRRELSGV